MGAAVSIEEFEQGDVTELLAMWRESFEHGVGIRDPHPIEEQESFFWDTVVPDNAVFVARLEGRIVGFVAATPETVSQLYVRVGYHRRGIGTRLLDWAKGRSNGSLWLSTFQRNTIARAFYERHGFRIVARGHEAFWDLDDLRYEWEARPEGTA